MTQFGKTTLLAKLEAISYDTRLKLTLPNRDDPQVVIIDINEPSLQREGRWPWSRDKLARLTTQLLDRYQARAVGFDVVFAEPDRSSGIDVLERLAQRDLREDRGYVATLDRLRPELDFDARFADAIRGRPVILGFGFTYEAQQIGALPPPLFRAEDIGGGVIPIQPAVGYTAAIAELAQAAAGSGHVDPFFDADNVVRRVPMVELYRNAYYPALSLAIARIVLEAKRVTPHFDSDQILDGFDVGGVALPTAADGTALIPFRGKPKTFRYYSAADVLAGSAPADFAGAIALVGTTAKGLQDLRPTPLAADFPGVEIHASLLSGMLNQNLKSVPANANAIEALIMLLTGLVVLFVIPYRDPVFNALGVVAVMGVVAAANLLLWIKLNEVVPVAATLLMLAVLFAWNMLAGFMREERKIRRVSAMFGEYVPRERVAQMVESGERYSMVGESRTMTVLFCDVRDFTAVSENLPPRELSAMLNAYLTPMTEIIHAHHGTVDKYVGDAIMAFWGAPIDNPNHARDAILAALAMQRRMSSLAEEFNKRGWPELAIGVGINSGAMNVGDMGSEFRKAYTVLGDAVNLASRLEGLTKEYGVAVIIGEEARAAVSDIRCREIDRVRVKGRANPVTIFEPLPEAEEAIAGELAAWEKALLQYRERRFADAAASLAALASAHPATRLYAYFAQRCAMYAAARPPADWDGATNFATK
ncbi:MAG TPA: adenylate/guanylate cyclase domain-containing protein [Casimicrobiaceae bacterium]|nr:adenylate/guanylate cyclase domain-containing protein [Casimicrobiaceae bacterium]